MPTNIFDIPFGPADAHTTVGYPKKEISFSKIQLFFVALNSNLSNYLLTSK